ncbi:MAG: DUF3887 domain-containing protein [Dehalococcoidales bacterium]|jgi:hypothetical protein|nr:DUF3887 domain-containing protein [Dehalococcoidales bacterium]NLT28202.1 DUF3887 domain-containing protein [Dehalococcoidales bacterium]
MKKSGFKLLGILAGAVMMCCALLAGCTPPLSSDFNEEDVKSAAENVITLINSQDSEGLKAICNVQMRQALTDDLLDQIYEAIGEGGQFKSIKDISVSGAKDKSSGEEFAMVVAKAEYEIRTFIFTITFTKQMKLAGLYYK